MDKKERIAESIKNEIKNLMDGLMDRNLKTDPFIPEKHHSSKPIYAALVPDEIFKGSHFERRFVTPFGNVWENLAKVVALEAHGTCEKGYHIKGNVGLERLKRIQEVLNSLEHSTSKNKKEKPNWDKELSYIIEATGEPTPVTVVSDIFVENKILNLKYAFELKGPLPNSD